MVLEIPFNDDGSELINDGEQSDTLNDNTYATVCFTDNSNNAQ
jgi:hypothetical protein